MDDFLFYDATVLAGLIRKKKLSCREIMHAHLTRIGSLNPRVNAIIQPVDEEQVLAIADQADQVIARGEPLGPLHGLPMATKEMVQVKDWPSTNCWAAGTREATLADMGFSTVQKEDGLLAARMRRAGALFIGKTNMPEFAFGSHTKNDLFGITRNPYDLTRTPGGSSGGAAAALACGMLPLADGSDLGGSLRNPASFCNVVGFRPSIGRVPNPAAGWAARMATEGPMARSVQDIALLLSAQAGYHPGDPLSIREPLTLDPESLKRDVKNCRIGWTTDFGALPVEKAVADVCRQSRSYFQDLGVEVSDEYPPIMQRDTGQGIIDAMSVFRTLRVVSLADKVRAFHQRLGKKGIRKYTRPITQYQMIDAPQQVDAAQIYEANENRARIYGLFLDFFETHDFLVTPTVQVSPFPVEQDYVRQINGQPMQDYLEWMSSCCIISITGLPVISMPCGFTPEGLPVGIQIIGKPGGDLAVLQLARAFEDVSRFSAKYKEYRPAIPGQ